MDGDEFLFGSSQCRLSRGGITLVLCPVCGILLKRLMPGSLSLARTRYPPAGCADSVNEFISRVAAAAVALSPRRIQANSPCRSAEWESAAAPEGRKEKKKHK